MQKILSTDRLHSFLCSNISENVFSRIMDRHNIIFIKRDFTSKIFAKRRWAILLTYHTDAREQCIRGKNISVINLTPKLRPDERGAAKRQIERQLYETFCKYVKDRT